MNHKNLLIAAAASFLIPIGSFAQTNVYDDIIATSPNHTYLKAAIDREFIDSDGNVRVAGAEDESDNNDFRI